MGMNVPNEPFSRSVFRDIFSQISNIQEEKRLLRYKEQSLKKRMPALLEQAIRALTQEEAKEECGEIYWLCEDFKGRAEIRQAFKKVFGRPLNIEASWATRCNGCGGTLEVNTTSWKDFRRRKSENNYCEGECTDNAADGMYD